MSNIIMGFIGLAAIIILIGYIGYLTKYSFKGAKSGYILIPGLAILLGGAVLYYIGFYPGQTLDSNWFSRIFRSLISSFELFVSETHFEEVHAEGDMLHNPIWMLLFMLCYCMALATSTFMIYELFFSRHLAKRWLKHHQKEIGEKRWFIFWGINEQSLMLAKDIQENGYCTDGYRMIFIDGPDSKDSAKRVSFFEMLLGHTQKGPFRNQIKKEIKNAKILFSKVSLFDVVPSFDNDGLELAELQGLKPWLKSANTEIFILSNDSDANLRVLSNLLEKDGDSYQAKFYCRALMNDYNLRVELCSKANVSIVDSSHLAVQNLIKNHTELHPVNFVDISRDSHYENIRIPKEDQNIYLEGGIKMGCVESPFNSMIVGFGEIGHEALSFLYEFGAFSNGKRKRSDFKCYVVDKEMDQLAGDFIVRTPFAKHNDLIVYEKDSIESDSFWNKLKKRIETMNYIIVSLGDDKLSMSIGLRLLEFAKKYRSSLQNFVVLVRNYNYDAESSRMERIYNDNLTDSGRTVIKCFAKKKDIWKYDVISDSLYYKNAKDYHENYRKTANDGYAPVSWDDLNEEKHTVLFNKEITDELRKKPNKMPLGIAMGDARKIRQDYHNELHAFTKKCLCDEDIFSRPSILDKIPVVNGFPDADDAREHYEIPIGLSKDESEMENLFMKILRNLADTEHIRWNASHEITGYTYGPEKNELIRQHNDLVECSELKSGVTIHYDWIVVKQSLNK